MKKILLYMFIALPVNIAHAQEQQHISEETVVTATAISACFQAGTVLESFCYSENYFPYLFHGTTLLQNTPSLILKSENSLSNFGTSAILSSLSLGSNYLFDNSINDVLFNFSHKYSMFSTYYMYTDLRQQTENRKYNNINQYQFSELYLAPFDIRNYQEWYIWGYLGSIALFSGCSFFSGDQANAIWTTGKAYIGTQELPIYAAIPLILALQIPNYIATGVGEESLYRGTYYEEMSYRFGQWPAKIADSVYFTVSHYPQKYEEIISRPYQENLQDFILSVGQTLWLQYIYEWGGLKQAITAHALTDIIFFFSDWLLNAGTENNNGFSINNRTLSISFSF